jgi:putative endonuclease
MSFLYILESLKNGRYYIGSTNDLVRRILEHNSGKTKSLRSIRPLKIVFQKEFENITDAKNAERKLKKMKSRVILQKIIEDQDIHLGL